MKRTPVEIFTDFAEVESPEVASIVLVEEHGWNVIKCQLRLPAAWRDGPIDGTLGLQLMRAVLNALDAIGEHFGLGPVPIQSQPTDNTDLDVPSLLESTQREMLYADVSAWVKATTDAMEPDHVLVLAKAAVPKSDQRLRQRLIGRLGHVTAHEMRNPAAGRTVAAWLIRTNW